MKRRLLFFFAAGVIAALATAEDAAPPAPAPPQQQPAASATPATPAVAAAGAQAPRYVPPSRGAPAARLRVGGGTRSAAAPGVPTLEALTPETLGLTLRETPSLYWHLSAPTAARIDFTLIDESSVAPLVDRTLEGPFAAGVHRIELDGLGVRLAADKQYQWYVALVADPEERSSDVVSGGGVARSDPAPLRDELAQAGESGEVLVLAREGIWYDAIDTLSRRIERAPSDPLPREQRATLLEQVGLAQVAAAERAGRPTP